MGLLDDARNILKIDPAAGSMAQVILLYPGFHALVFYKISNWFYRRNCLFMARFVSQFGRLCTNIEIHPGATIGKHFFIDHGAGVVIGETAEVGDNVTIYHGVTLGGTGKESGKRHPTIEDNVLLGAGVKVLGPIVIGSGSRVGANSTVLRDIPADSTAVGSPAVLVRQGGLSVAPSAELNQRDYPNILEYRILELEQRLDELVGGKNGDAKDIEEAAPLAQHDAATSPDEEVTASDSAGAEKTE